MLVGEDTHVPFGGDEANVLPATGQSMRHAVAVMVRGGSPESNIGDGREPDDGGLLAKRSVAGSMAYSQGPVASNCRSTARDSWALRWRTVWFRGMSKA